MLEISRHLASTYEVDEIKIISYLENCDNLMKQERTFFRKLRERLEQKKDRNGQLSWGYVMEECKDFLYLNDTQWYWMKHLAEGWFGLNKEENKKILERDCRIIQDMLEEYLREERHKQRYLIPVSVLLGFVLIIVII